MPEVVRVSPTPLVAGTEPHSQSGNGLLALLRLALRRPVAPHDWLRVAGFVMLGNAITIVTCLVISRLAYGNYHRLFGEKHLGTLVSVGVLVASGVVCLKIAKQLPLARVRRFWKAFGVLLCIAAADDLLRLHEKLDKWLHALFGWNANDRLTDHIDDALVFAYVLPAVYLAWRHRLVLAQAALMVQVLGVAAVLFIVHLAIDVFGLGKAIEESFKQTAGCCILLAVLAVYMDKHLLRAWNGRSAN